MRRATRSAISAAPSADAEALAHGGGRRHVVVGDAALLDGAVVGDQGEGGARVAVERHPDAAGVQQPQVVAAGGGAVERQVGVAGDQQRLVDLAQQRGLAGRGLRQQARHVRQRRAVAAADPVEDRLRGQRRQPRDGRVAELSGAPARRRPHRRRRLGRGVRPALAVAADPGRAAQLREPHDGLARPCAEQRVVAAEQPAGGAGGVRLGEHGVERRQVAVDVVEDREHRRGRS